MPSEPRRRSHIKLTSHPGGAAHVPIAWGAADPVVRGPVIGSTTAPEQRNVIGTHAGAYSVYRALAVAAGALDPSRQPDLTNTAPTDLIGPHPQWSEPDRIVSLDPFGAVVARSSPTSSTRATTSGRPSRSPRRTSTCPRSGARSRPAACARTATSCAESGAVVVTKAAIEPVWYLPGVARRFGVRGVRPAPHAVRADRAACSRSWSRAAISRCSCRRSAARPSTCSATWRASPIPRTPLTARVHDECNGSDVFGSDICTCRPYLTHGIEECIRTAQEGGAGVIVYNRKEGRALGEVTKFLVYNARKRQEGGDRAAQYFARTECVAGVQDMRFQELMPDVLHWLGIATIDRFVSMSNMKYDAIVRAGHRDRRARADPRRADPGGRARRDGRQDGRRLLHRRATPRTAEDARAAQGARARVTAEVDHAGDAAAAAAVRYLRTPDAIRERCASRARARARTARSTTSAVDLPRLAAAADLRRRDHARALSGPRRSRRTAAGGTSTPAASTAPRQLERALAAAIRDERARARSISSSTSVLLDAGAGRAWRYVERETGATHARSEGLAVASFRLFAAGVLFRRSGRTVARRRRARSRPSRTNGSRGPSRWAPTIRWSASPARAGLLRASAEALRATPGLFGDRAARRRSPRRAARPGGKPSRRRRSSRAVLDALGPIWPGRLALGAVNLGDVWPHPAAGGDGPAAGLVPFHKLSQWLTLLAASSRSREAGCRVTGVDALTGLAEYRNGGLFVDAGVLVPRARRGGHATRTRPATRSSSSGAR